MSVVTGGSKLILLDLNGVQSTVNSTPQNRASSGKNITHKVVAPRMGEYGSLKIRGTSLFP